MKSKNTNRQKLLSAEIEGFYKMMRAEKGSSENTIDTYSYAFKLLYRFYKEKLGLEMKDVTLRDFSRENITAFYSWLEENGSSATTRNNRRAAVSALASFIAEEEPEYMHACLQITAIPRKKEDRKLIPHASVEGLQLILSVIDTDDIDGVRDRVMITILCVSGIRVSELTNLKIGDVRFGSSPSLLVHGKGSKDRLVYIPKKAASMLLSFLELTGREGSSHLNDWLFTNHEGEHLTRFGVNYLVKKYVVLARKIDPALVPEDFSTHKFRHSFAMAQLEVGTGLFEIKELLGHAQVTTTQKYAKTASSIKKKEALEKVAKNIVDDGEEPLWIKNDEVREFLNGLKNGEKLC